MNTPKQIAETYKECLEAVKDVIPKDLLDPDDSEMYFTAEDYRAIASSVMIEFNRQGKGGYRGGASKNGGNYSGPSTEGQQKYLAGLAAKLGKKAEDVIQGYLEANSVEAMDKLNKSQATTLIDMLKEL